jgi:UDP-N-acetylglucosamine 4,6-dehydratase
MIWNFLEAPRSTKRAISVAYDCIAILFAIYAATTLRFGSPQELTNSVIYSSLTALAVSLTIFIKLGLYRAILRYIGHQAIVAILVGTSLSALSLAAASFFYSAGLPRSIPIIYFFISLILIGLPRLMVRGLVHALKSKEGEAVLIYGAGSCGHQLCSELQNGNRYRPVGFIDDDRKLQNTSIRGLPIHKSKRIGQIINNHKVTIVLLAISSLTNQRRQQIISQIEPYQVKIKTVPSREDIITGKSQVSELVDVDIIDLLGRPQVEAREELLDKYIRGKSVMVTGAGGSIGSELSRQILTHSPDKLVLFELNELSLYQIERELEANLPPTTQIACVIGSVQDQVLLEQTMKQHKIQTIYHAAAYKHVPLMEKNILAAINNNIFGTATCAEAAIKQNVEAFVLISTDKAVRPTNIMGATKRVAELTLQALASKQNKTRFTMVRFGNVLGSSGSVVPLFREQIKKGGPVTVTHPEVIRYFMTIPEASELVIQAGSLGSGGDVFVLDMGEPLKILDLAERMIHLSGLEVKNTMHPEGQIEVVFTGLRPGEKLFEELLVGNDVEGTDHPRIMRATESSMSWKSTSELLDTLKEHCNNQDSDSATTTLLNAPIEYRPNNGTETAETTPDLTLVKTA